MRVVGKAVQQVYYCPLYANLRRRRKLEQHSEARPAAHGRRGAHLALRSSTYLCVSSPSPTAKRSPLPVSESLRSVLVSL